MTFQPFNPPVDLPQEPCGRLTAREVVVQKMFWSLGCVITSCISMTAMVCLVEWHGPGTSMLIADQFPFGKVVIPLGIAAMAASLALLFSVPVFLSGRFMPTLWLLPLAFVVLCFYTCYDWYGLINFGKPRFEFGPRSMNFAWLIFRYGGGCQVLLLSFGMTALFKWQHWYDKGLAVRTAAATDQIIADEITAWSVQTIAKFSTANDDFF